MNGGKPRVLGAAVQCSGSTEEAHPWRRESGRTNKGRRCTSQDNQSLNYTHCVPLKRTSFNQFHKILTYLFICFKSRVRDEAARRLATEVSPAPPRRSDFCEVAASHKSWIHTAALTCLLSFSHRAGGLSDCAALNSPADLKERARAPPPVSGLSLNLHFYRIVKWSQWLSAMDNIPVCVCPWSTSILISSPQSLHFLFYFLFFFAALCWITFVHIAGL